MSTALLDASGSPHRLFSLQCFLHSDISTKLLSSFRFQQQCHILGKPCFNTISPLPTLPALKWAHAPGLNGVAHRERWFLPLHIAPDPEALWATENQATRQLQ